VYYHFSIISDINMIVIMVVDVINMEASFTFKFLSSEYITATSAVGIIEPSIMALIVIEAVLKKSGSVINNTIPGMYFIIRPFISDTNSSLSRLKSRKYPITKRAKVVFGSEICSTRLTIKLGNLNPNIFKVNAIIYVSNGTKYKIFFKTFLFLFCYFGRIHMQQYMQFQRR